MASIRIATNFNIDLEFESAPFSRRMVAFLIDIVILSIYWYVFITVLQDLFINNPNTALFLYVMGIIPYVSYHLLMEIFMKGQSIGKRLMRLRVVNEKGGSAAVSQYIIRWMIRSSDLMLLISFIYISRVAESFTYLWYILAPVALFLLDLYLVNAGKGQRLGDILAHTMVIYHNPKSGIEDSIFMEVSEDYVPSFPQIMTLSDKDINSIKQILLMAKSSSNYIFAETAAEKIKSRLNIDTTLSPFDFLEVLLKDYNYLSTR